VTRSTASGVLEADEHLAVKVAWLIYQKIIAAYADPNRRRGKNAMIRLIESIRRRIGGDRPTRPHPVDTPQRPRLPQSHPLPLALTPAQRRTPPTSQRTLNYDEPLSPWHRFNGLTGPYSVAVDSGGNLYVDELVLTSPTEQYSASARLTTGR
jgi:hypothetical protein